ncbi:MAG: HAD family phosphatase [Oscillospiraceae bacterium]|nr:HAD family phosphatase [Oscillospiraceae bacterium]
MHHNDKRIVLFSDMDGTFLDHDKTISDKNMAAIRRLRESGGMFVMATGRILQATRHYFEPLSLDCPCILCNGSMIYDCRTGEVAWAVSLDRDITFSLIRDVLDKFPQVAAEVCMPEGIYVVQLNDVERMHWKLAGFSPLPEVVDSLDDVPEGDISKILFSIPEELMPEVESYWTTLRYHDTVEFVTSSPIFFEILPKGSSKGAAMKKLMEIYRLEGCYTVAMGDYDNDIEMLRYADLAACPSNAHDTVKQVCDIVTDTDCDGGSVADVIDTLLRKGSFERAHRSSEVSI